MLLFQSIRPTIELWDETVCTTALKYILPVLVLGSMC